MEDRMVKLYARNNGKVALHAIPGHFATAILISIFTLI